MSVNGGWGGVAAMLLLAVGAFGYSFWLRAGRRKAIQGGGGIDVARMGTAIFGAGLLMGVSSPLFGEFSRLAWQEMVGATLLGVVAGLLLAGRITAKWDAALRESHALQAHVVAWWESRWAVLGIMLVLLLFSLLYPNAVASFAGALGNLGATSGFLISGFFLASGLSILFWAKRRAREYGKPVKLPLTKAR